MNKSTETTCPALTELTTDQPPATDQSYLDWKDAKIKKALAAANKHPEKRIAQSEVWKRFGLER